MSGRVLLMIDMLKDFVDQDGALSCGPTAREIVPYVLEKAREFDANQEKIIFINDEHNPNDLEFNRFPPHCVKGTEGAKPAQELEEFLNECHNCIKISKARYSGFYGTDLDEKLKEINPSEVHLVGVCTNICVLYTAEELCNRDYKTIVHKNGVTSFDPDAHKWALDQMEKVLGAQIV